MRNKHIVPHFYFLNSIFRPLNVRKSEVRKWRREDFSTIVDCFIFRQARLSIAILIGRNGPVRVSFVIGALLDQHRWLAKPFIVPKLVQTQQTEDQ